MLILALRRVYSDQPKHNTDHLVTVQCNEYTPAFPDSSGSDTMITHFAMAEKLLRNVPKNMTKTSVAI